MPETPLQSATLHTRWNPPYHFIAFPAVLVWAIYQIYLGITEPSTPAMMNILLGIGLVLGIFTARTMTLTVQDRVIRLEETLRMQRLLPDARHDEIDRLTRRHFVALRFASDQELSELVRKITAGDLSTPKEIKGAIKQWRADWLRA